MLYQHTNKASKGNGFCWDTGTPSIFAADKEYKVWKDGKSQSQFQAEVNVAKRERKDAHLLSMRPTPADRAEKVLAKRHSGIYSRAGV